MGDSCSSGTSYMHCFHCIHNYVHQLKRKCPMEITLHKGLSNVHLSVLISVLEMMVAHWWFWRYSSPPAPVQLFKLLLHNACYSDASAVPISLQSPSKKENCHFLYNTTKQFVKWNTEVMVKCNQATWNVVKCSQSKYRKKWDLKG